MSTILIISMLLSQVMQQDVFYQDIQMFFLVFRYIFLHLQQIWIDWYTSLLQLFNLIDFELTLSAVYMNKTWILQEIWH